MSSALPENISKLWKSCLVANPSVCEYEPSVCSHNSLNGPFVGINMPNARFQPSASRILGFTVIEIVVTLAVSLTLISLAYPSFRTLTQNSRMAAQINDLIADLNYTRSEAIKRRAAVTICTSSDGATCSAGNWANGRLIRDANLVALRYRGALDATTDTLTSALSSYSYDSKGGVAVAISFKFCDVRGASFGKLVNVNSIGQAALDRVNPPATCP